MEAETNASGGGLRGLGYVSHPGGTNQGCLGFWLDRLGRALLHNGEDEEQNIKVQCIHTTGIPSYDFSYTNKTSMLMFGHVYDGLMLTAKNSWFSRKIIRG